MNKPFYAWAERVFVGSFPILISVIFITLIGTMILVIIYDDRTIESIGNVVDIVIKTGAIIIGFIWAVNRYFAYRTDKNHLNVEYSINLSNNRLKDRGDIAFYRIDVLNTSLTLLQVEGVFIEISKVLLLDDDIFYESIHRWPEREMHKFARIEPKSWGGISGAFVCPSDVFTVRTYIEMKLHGGETWTWHRIENLDHRPKT